ncbi:MAG: type II secretion system F family protein, partial [Pseudomonadota bacterium]
ERMAESEELRNKLAQAGLRGQKPLISFLFFRFTLPIVFMGGAAFYLFFVNDVGQPPGVRSVVVLVAAFIGFFLPSLLVQNIIQKRRQSIMKAFPDALDLLLICVESGMSIEAAFNKVAHEVGTQSVELAEEMALTTAELSYLQDRRTAYENLAMRTGHPGVKAVCTSLVQAEKYGSPVGQALRIMSEENRQMRMNAAEKKAAALPAQLTVPMITFFLPVLFVVILGPTAIQFIFK